MSDDPVSHTMALERQAVDMDVWICEKTKSASKSIHLPSPRNKKEQIAQKPQIYLLWVPLRYSKP